MIVHIKGVQIINKGAELMLLAILAELRARRPDLRIALRTSRWLPRSALARFAALELLPLRWRSLDLTPLAARVPAPLRGFTRRAGVVTEPDCAAILDASGYAYGGAWNPWAMRYTAAEIGRLARRGRPYIFLPQSFGPFAPGDATQRFAAALPAAALICARDGESQEHLLRLGGSAAARIARYPDFTLRLAGDAGAARRFGVEPESVLLIPNVHMTGGMNADVAARQRYFDVMVALARRARALGHPVRVLNHAGTQDAALAARLAATIGAGPVLEDPDPLALKGLIGAAALVISSRFHGCVNALAQAVPCLATGWSHKYQALFDEFGLPESLVGVGDAEAVAGRLEDMLRQREIMAGRLRDRLPALRERVGDMWDRVFAVLPGAAS